MALTILTVLLVFLGVALGYAMGRVDSRPVPTLTPPPLLKAPEPEKTVFYPITDASGAEFVTLYVVGTYTKKGGGWDVVYTSYYTCEQAHAEHPNSSVKQLRALRIGGLLYHARAFEKLEPISVQPKPKVAKGRK